MRRGRPPSPNLAPARLARTGRGWRANRGGRRGTAAEERAGVAGLGSSACFTKKFPQKLAGVHYLGHLGLEFSDARFLCVDLVHLPILEEREVPVEVVRILERVLRFVALQLDLLGGGRSLAMMESAERFPNGVGVTQVSAIGSITAGAGDLGS